MFLFWKIIVSTFIYFLLCEASSVPFQNCGSHFSELEVDDVIVKNCSSIPCFIAPGEKLDVTLVFITNGIEADFKTLKTSAIFTQFGFGWKCAVTSDDPCHHWMCPLRGSVSAPLNYSVSVHIADNIQLKRPGRISLSLDNINTPHGPLPTVCASFPMNLR